MNKEYVKDHRKVIVLSDNGVETREKTDNIVDVLETENNIEEIQALKPLVKKSYFTNLKNNKDFFVKKELFKTVTYLALFIAFITTLLMEVVGVFPALHGFCWCTLCSGLITMLKIAQLETKAEMATDAIIKRQDKLVSIELQNQHAKLKELVKNARIDKSFIPSEIGIVRKINNTELLKNLKRKLELINFYELNKEGFILTKINEGNFSDSEKEFLKSLIIEDMKEQEKKKTKIFKK